MFEGVSNLSSIGDAGTHHGYGSGWKLGNTYSQKEQSDISTDAQGVVGSMVVFQNHGHVALKDVAIGTVGVGRDPEVHLVAHTGLCREVRLQTSPGFSRTEESSDLLLCGCSLMPMCMNQECQQHHSREAQHKTG